MEIEVARTTDAFREKQDLSLTWIDIYLKYRIAAFAFIFSVVISFLIVSSILLATEPKNLPNLSKSQTSVSLNSMASKSSTTGTGKSSVPGTGKSSTESSLLTPEQEKQVDEILTIVRSNETKFDNAELNEALTGKNKLIEEIFTKCTENTQENEKVNGEAILKLMMCANNTESYTGFGLHLKSTIFKIKDPFDKPAENFWNVNLDDAASDIPSSESERTKIVDKVSGIVALDTLSTSFVCNNLVDSFAKTNVPPFTGKLWYEYVVKNFKTEGYYLCTLLNKFDEAIDSKDPLLQIDEVFEKIQEKDMFKSSWNNRVTDSFMDYLIRNGKVKQLHLLAYMENASDANEKEKRFSKICSLITDLDTYKKILDEIKFGFGTSCTSIPIFDTEILLKDSNFNAELELLCNTLVELKLDAMLKHSIEKLNPFGLLVLKKHPKFVLKEFPQTCDYIFKICSEDSSNAYYFLYGPSDENRLELLKNTTLTDYSEIVTISTLNDEMLKIIDAKGKYDKIKEYKVDSPEFEKILELNFKYEMPNLNEVVLSNIQNATIDEFKNVSADNKKKICDRFITEATKDREQCSKNIATLMSKNAIPSSFSFPAIISSEHKQTIIDNVTDDNINNVFVANADSSEIFNSLISSTHLKDVTPLVISKKFSTAQLEELDKKNLYASVPHPTSYEFVVLLQSGEDLMPNLMKKLNVALKTANISEIISGIVLEYVFKTTEFQWQLVNLDVIDMIKIYERSFSVISMTSYLFFTESNVSALIDHFTQESTRSSVACAKRIEEVLKKCIKIPRSDYDKICNRFPTNVDLQALALNKLFN